MSTTLGESLSRAFQHIEADEHSEALQILEPLLETDSDNADVWWLYAHATDDVEEAQRAVNRVTRLRPDYPGAEQLLDQVNTKMGRPQAGGIRRLGEQIDDDVFEQDADFDHDFDDEYEDLDAELAHDTPVVERKTRSRRSLVLPFALLAVLLLVILFVILFLRDGDDGEPPATAGAQIATLRPTESDLIPTVESTSDVEPTQEASTLPTLEPTQEMVETPTLEPTAVVLPEVTDAIVPTETIPTTIPSPEPAEFSIASVFSAFTLPEDSGTVIISDLGRTYLVSVCSDQAENPREILNRAMETLGEAATSLPEDVDAMAVELRNCAVDRPINTIGVPFTMARGFFEGNVSESDYVRQWRVIEPRN